MTTNGSAIGTRLATGDYFEALGVSMLSDATEIAIAAARLAGERPDEARRINAAAAVLRDPRQREIYLIARTGRERLEHHGFEPELRAAIPDLRLRIWQEIQHLLNCDFELGQVNIGPRGARSLLERHEWIKNAVVNTAFPVLTPSQSERRSRVAGRTIIYRQDCASCGGTGGDDCGCRDEYWFAIPSGASPGTLLGAPGEGTGRFTYMILDRAVHIPRPYRALYGIYFYYRRQGILGEASDVTLEEMQVKLQRDTRVMAVVYAAAAIALGWFLSSPVTGLLAALPAIAALLVPGGLGYALPRRTVKIILAFALASQPLIGAVAGHFLASPWSGAATGAVLSGCLLLLLLLGRMIRA